jgi:organic hydroperoxide reductase OsmC/OhrA
MLETPITEGQERAAETAKTVERHAHILWIDHGGGGHGYLRGGSRAFSPLPASLADTTDSRSLDTTPGELLAAAVRSSFAVTLADLLVRRGTPTLELGVDATCQIAESECGQTITIDVDLVGRTQCSEPT